MTPRRIQILEIAAGHLACARFASRADRLVLEHWDAVTIDPQWTANLQSFEQLGPPLAVFAARQPKGACVLLLPGNLVLGKTLAVAPDEPRLGNRRAFDPVLHLPLPLSELVWDRQDLGGDEQGRGTLLVAARRAAVESLCEIAGGAGLAVERVVPAVTGLLYVVRRRAATANGGAIVASMGARSTLLALAVGSRCAARSIPLVMASDGGVPRLEDELRRTFAHWQRLFGFAMPSRMEIAGGGSRRPGLSERLAAELGLTVERLAAWPGLDNTPEQLGPEIVGAAGAILDGDRLPDLSPESLVRARTRRQRRRLHLAVTALVMLALLPPLLSFRAEAAMTRQRVQSIERETRALTALASANSAQLRRREELQNRVNGLSPARAARDSWLQFLSELQQALLEVGDISLERLQVTTVASGHTVNEPRRLVLGGRLPMSSARETPGGSSASDRARRLLERLTAFRGVAALEGEQFEPGNGGSLDFTVTLVLKPGVAL